MRSSATLAALVAHCRKLARRRQISDAELLRRFAAQRDAAFEELLQRYAPLVWGVCRRILHNDTDCEDAFQATFLALVRQAGALDADRPLGAWLHTIAVRTSAKARARAQRQQTQANAPERTTCGDVADELANRELFGVVDEEIARLPALLQAPFVLCCLEGRTRDEAATALDCSVAAIKSRLERGRHLLRQRLERRGFGLPAAFLVLGLTGGQVRASLRAKALHSALGCASPAVAALVPAAGASLTSKLAVTAMSVVMAGALGVCLSFPRSAWERTLATLRVASDPPAAEGRDAERPDVRSHAPRGNEDRFGDPLPDGAVRRFGTLRFRHAGVHNLAFTPDGKQLIAGKGTDPLAVFDAATGRKLRTVGKSTPNNFGEFALSPDGKKVACCGFDVFVWDLETGRLIRELKCGRCQSVAFSPDGKKVAVVPEWRAEIVIVEIATGKRLAEWAIKKGWVNNWNFGQYDLRSLSFSPDGKYLAGDLSEFREKKAKGLDIELVSSHVCVLDAAKGTLVRTIEAKGEDGKSTDIATHSPIFQPGNGLLASIGEDGIIYFWDMGTGRETQRFPLAKGEDGNGKRLGHLRFSADGRRCAAILRGQNNRPGTLLVLETKTGRELRRIELGSTEGPAAVALTADGAAVASGMLYGESCVRVWDVESGKERLADAGHRTAAALSLSADGRTLISEGSDGRVIHWDLRSGNSEVRPAVKPASNREEVGRLIYTPGSQWNDFTLLGRRWRLTYKGQLEELEVRSLDGSKLLGKCKVPAPAYRVRFVLSPDGSYLACAFNEGGDVIRPWRLMVWDPMREKEPRHFGGGPRGFSCDSLQFTHDGKRLIAGINPTNPNPSENTVCIWDVAAAKIVRKLSTLTSPGGMILTADDRLLITSDDMGRVWDLETGKELAQLVKKKISLAQLLKKGWSGPSFHFLSSDERFLACNSDEGFAVWETSSWKPIRSFAAHLSPNSLVFSRDGRSLFVADSDSTILEWDVSGRSANGRRQPPGETTNRDRLNILWNNLAETPDKAYPAVWEMLDHPAESVPFLIGKLAPVQSIEERRARQLLEKLDAESFDEREEANRQLLALGEPTLPVLRQALKDRPSLEAKKRIERVIEEFTSGPKSDQLQLLRALAVLEWSNRPEAGEHLRRLAGGAPSARVTRAAKAAQQRR